MRVLFVALAAIALCGLSMPTRADSLISCKSRIDEMGAFTGTPASMLVAVNIRSGCKRMSEEEAAHDAAPELRNALQQWRTEVFRDKPFFDAGVYHYTLKITNPQCEHPASYVISIEDAYANDGVWLYLQVIQSSRITLPPRTSVTLAFLSPLPPVEHELRVGQESVWYNGIWSVSHFGKIRVAVPQVNEPVSEKSLIFFSLQPRFEPATDLPHPMFSMCSQK